MPQNGAWAYDALVVARPARLEPARLSRAHVFAFSARATTEEVMQSDMAINKEKGSP
jgi:hypothetical protein